MSRKQQCQLAGGGRFAAPLQAAQHEDRGAVFGEAKAMIDRPHELDQFAVNDLDDLLAGIERAEDILADGFFGDAGDKFVGDRVIDVGFQKRGPDLLQALP